MNTEPEEAAQPERGKSPNQPVAASPKKKRAARKMPIGRRDILILGTIWLVGCAIVAGLVALFYTQIGVEKAEQPRPNATFEIPFTGGTAKTAYLLALAHAQSWESDVQLVTMSTHWSNITVEDLGQVDVWDFSFFSTRHQRVYFTIVATDQPVIGRAHPYKLRKPPYLIDPAKWVIDSDEAISIWANNGGGVFLGAFPDSAVEALLRQSPDEGEPVWNIIGINADQSQLFFLAIDATSGNILN